jgi:hypothetical protein
VLKLGDAADKDEQIKTLKKEMNDWTASYRTGAYGGRPSFSNMYSAVNALAGHWNSFGSEAPVPKKRLDRIQKARSLLLSFLTCIFGPSVTVRVQCHAFISRPVFRQPTRPFCCATSGISPPQTFLKVGKL